MKAPFFTDPCPETQTSEGGRIGKKRRLKTRKGSRQITEYNKPGSEIKEIREFMSSILC